MASKGTSKFIAQRGSAVILLPLMIWFLISLIGQLGNDQTQMQTWLAKPWNGIPMALLVIVGAMHMRIGVSEVVEDYIHGGVRSILMGINWVVAVGVAAAAALSVLALVFGS
ncbi:MAG: succinate dehydrogenase, hydrophobic membrane anchor protein [Pseudomonadota bacterium]